MCEISKCKIFLAKKVETGEYRFSIMEEIEGERIETVFAKSKNEYIFITKIQNLLWNKNIPNFDKLQQAVRYSKKLDDIISYDTEKVPVDVLKKVQVAINKVKEKDLSVV